MLTICIFGGAIAIVHGIAMAVVATRLTTCVAPPSQEATTYCAVKLLLANVPLTLRAPQCPLRLTPRGRLKRIDHVPIAQ